MSGVARRRTAARNNKGGAGTDGNDEYKPSSSDVKQFFSAMYSPELGFKYNKRVATVVIPSLFLVFAFGGAMLAGVFSAGVAAILIASASGLAPPLLSVALWWVTVLAGEVVVMIKGFFLIHISVYNLLLLWHMGTFLMMLGLWGSLQSAWIRRRATVIAVVFEKILFAVLPITTTVILAWGAVAFGGVGAAPYALAAILAVQYLLFFMPDTESSFRNARDKMSAHIVEPVSGAKVTMLFSVVFLYAPVCFYAALNHPRLASFPKLDITVWADLALVASIPAALLGFFVARFNAMAFLGWSEEVGRKRLHLALTLPSLSAMAIAVQFRVVFVSFSHYITLPAPWNYGSATLVVLCTVVLVYLHVMDMARSLGRVVTHGLAIGGAVGGALLVGAPTFVLLFPLLTAYSIAEFYMTSSVKDYAGFVGGIAGCLIWFLRRSFWHLEYEFYLTTPVAGNPSLSLQGLVVIVFVLAVAALLTPVAVSMFDDTPIPAFLVVCHAAGFALIEGMLFTQFQGMYRASLVIGTTCAGLYLVAWMRDGAVKAAGGSASEAAGTLALLWLAACIYVAKLGVLLTPPPIPTVTLSSLFLAVTISPPLLMRRGSMSTVAGAVQAGAIWLAAFTTRTTVPARLLMMATGRAPSDALLFALHLLICGAACLPLTYVHFHHVPLARRINVWVVGSGLVMAWIQPSLALDDVWASFTYTFEAGNRFGLLNHSRALWPQWSIALAAILAVGLLLSAVPLPRGTGARALLGSTFGALLGLGVCGFYVPPEPRLYFVLVLSFVLAALFLVFVTAPTPASAPILPLVYTLFFSLLPVAVTLESVVFRGLPARVRTENALLTRTAVLGLYAGFNVAIALFSKFHLGGGMSAAAAASSAAAARKRDEGADSGAVGGGRRGTAGRRTMRRTAARLSAMAEADVGGSASRDGDSAGRSGGLGGDGGKHRRAPPNASLPVIGNMATVTAFVLSVVVNVRYLDGSLTSVFFLSPLLLLLSRDAYLCRGLKDSNRYFPLLLVSVLVLVAAAAYDILVVQLFWRELGLAMPSTIMSMLSLSKNTALLSFTVPGLFLALRYLWTFEKQVESMWLFYTPLFVLPVVLGDLWALRILGVLGLICGAMVVIVSRSVKQRGQDFI